MWMKNVLNDIDGTIDDMSAVLEDRELRGGVHAEEVHVHVFARERVDVVGGVVDTLLFQRHPHFLAVQRIGVVV